VPSLAEITGRQQQARRDDKPAQRNRLPRHPLSGPRPRLLRTPARHPPPDRPPRRQARRPRLRGHPRPHPRPRTRPDSRHRSRLTSQLQAKPRPGSATLRRDAAARPAEAPFSGQPLPGLAATLRPQPAARAVQGIPRSLPLCRRRGRRSRWSDRSKARTSDLEVRRGDGHTRPRARPWAHVRRWSHSTRRPSHPPPKRPPQPL